MACVYDNGIPHYGSTTEKYVLKPMQRDVCKLIHEGHSISEIAKMFKKTPSWIRQIKSKALQKLEVTIEQFKALSEEELEILLDKTEPIKRKK